MRQVSKSGITDAELKRAKYVLLALFASRFRASSSFLVPSFHHSVAILLLPFRRSVVPFFRSVAAIALAGENGNAGNVFPHA